MQQSPAENSFYPIVGPVRPAVPTEDVLRRRAKAYAEAWWHFIIWVLLALGALGVIAGLIFGGWSALLKVLALAHTPLFEELLYLLTFVGGGMYFGYALWKGIDELFSLRAFRRLYQVCSYVDPVQLAQYRLSHLILQHPSHFTFAFSGTKLVVSIQVVKTQAPPRRPSVTITMEKPEPATGTSTGAEPQSGAAVLMKSEVVWDSPRKEVDQVREETVSDGHYHETDEAVATHKLSFLIDIHQSVSLALVAETSSNSPQDAMKTEVEIPLRGNPYYEALVARLAIRGKEQVERVRLMTDIYGKSSETTKQMEQSFYDDMRRIREQVKKIVERRFAGAAIPTDHLKLFESEKKTWFLSESCSVRGEAFLRSWYRKIKTMRQRSNTLTLSENKLVILAEQLIKDYSQGYLDNYDDEEGYTGGYLIQKLHEDPFTAWAPAFFQESRNQFIYVLTFIAECMHQLGSRKREPSYYQKAARYYKECAYAATCSPIDEEQGEKALRSCIDMYMSSQDGDAAQELLEVYAKRMEKVKSVWELAAATKKRIEHYNLIYD